MSTENKNENQDENKNENQDENKNENQDENQKVKKINLLNIEIDNENKALNVLIGFINIAQKRGCFAINESAKIHECIQLFMKKQ